MPGNLFTAVIPPVKCNRYGPRFGRFLFGRTISFSRGRTATFDSSSGRRFERRVDPTVFSSHLSGLNFALGASYGFEPTFFGHAAGELVVLVIEGVEFPTVG